MHALSTSHLRQHVAHISVAGSILRRPRPQTAVDGPQALNEFFDRVPLARRRVLMIDYDGTLAPFSTDRFLAQPYPGARDLLMRIHTQPATRLVIVSGRPAREAADLLGLAPRPETWGVHGWERLTPAGQLVRAILPAQAKLALHRLQGLRPQLEAAGALIEEKYASIAVHTRGLAEPAVQRVRELLTEFEPRADGQPRLDAVYLQMFDGGYELRALGPNKGTVVRGVLREESRDTLIAYLGDDVTDEDAFHALGGRGLAVRVLPPGTTDLTALRPSAAQVALRAPDELLSFLARWGETPIGNAHL